MLDKFVSITKSIMAGTSRFFRQYIFWGENVDYTGEEFGVRHSYKKLSDQLRGPLAPLGGPPDSKRVNWAFSEN